MRLARPLSLSLIAALAASAALCAQQPAPQASQQATSSAPIVDAARVARLEATVNDFGGLARYRQEDLAIPSSEKGRVVFLGDSITDSWGRGPDTGTFFPGKPYLNRGISGQTTPQMLVRFRQDVLDLYPDAVVILAGTNDIAGNTGISTLVMIEDNLRSMVELAKANHVRPILASVLPAADYPWRPGRHPAETIRDLNRWMAEFCRQQKITYLDYYSAMVDADGGMKPGISSDGVHPNAEGYAIMGPLAEKAIAK